MTYFWLILAVAFAVVELATPQLVSIWFCAGSLIAMVCSILGADLWLQIAVCILSSLILLAATRPLYRKYVKPHVVPTNSDALIGKIAVTMSTVGGMNEAGQVRVGGQVWSAVSESGGTIPEGTNVVINGISGVHLLVGAVDAE